MNDVSINSNSDSTTTNVSDIHETTRLILCKYGGDITVDVGEWINNSTPIFTGMWLLIQGKVQSLENFMEHLVHVSWAI